MKVARQRFFQRTENACECLTDSDGYFTDPARSPCSSDSTPAPQAKVGENSSSTESIRVVRIAKRMIDAFDTLADRVHYCFDFTSVEHLQKRDSDAVVEN